MKEGFNFFFNLKKYQSDIIRKGGTINSLTILSNNHTSGTKQKTPEEYL